MPDRPPISTQEDPASFTPSNRSTAKARLVQAAMRFFAERGVSGVSMIEIGAAAGNRNKSAVAYHFDGRAGLITAIYDNFQAFLEPRFEKELARLEALPPDRLTLFEIGLAMNAPYFALYASPGGEVALKTMARLSHEPKNDSESYLHVMGRIFKRFERLVLLKVPHKSPGQVKFHLAHFLMATVNGLALTVFWKEEHFHGDPELLLELMLSYNDYVTGGQAGSDTQRPNDIDLDYWRAAITP